MQILSSSFFTAADAYDRVRTQKINHTASAHGARHLSIAIGCETMNNAALYQSFCETIHIADDA